MATEQFELSAGGDVCEYLETSAKESAQSFQQEMIQLATSPRAHACVPGLVERRFHSIHLRDFYSVVNFLLLQLYVIRRERSECCEGTGDTTTTTNVSNSEQVMKLKKQINDLEKKRRETKLKYDELYKINQQWSDDYNILYKQLQASKGANTDPTLPCQRCTILSREVEEKQKLMGDLNGSLEKAKLREKELLREMEQKNKLIQELLNECSALRLQFQEIGGVSAAIRRRDGHNDLLYEIQKLKEKNTQLEIDRARLQTQINKFRQSVRQLLFDPNSAYYKSMPYTNHTSHKLSPQPSHTGGHSHNYLPRPAVGNGASYDVRTVPTSEGYVFPKQFAPLSMSPRKRLHYGTTSKYIQPPTPPGLISRGKDFFDDDSPVRYETHPYKPDTITEQVIGNGSISHTSSQYLEPSTYINDKLPSPCSVPRPLSAPGSLLLSPAHSPMSISTHQLFSNNVTPTLSDSEIKRPTKLDLTHNAYQTMLDGHHSNNVGQNDSGPGCHSNNTPIIKMDFISDNSNMYCPRCNAVFTQESIDDWFDHISSC